MNLFSKHLQYILLIFMGLHGLVNAQEITDFYADPKQVIAGEEVLFTLRLNPAVNGNNLCAVLVEFGNGEAQYVRVNTPTTQSELVFPVRYKYPNPGNYKASVKGKLMVRGLNTLSGCSGEKFFTVVITDPESIKIKMELERTQRELKEREERETMRREQELKQREDALKRREEEAHRIRLEAEKNRAQSEIKRPTPSATPKTTPGSNAPNASGF